MTKTVELPADLDFPVEEVACDRCDNKATHRIVSHGCAYGLGCLPCLKRHRRIIQEDFDHFARLGDPGLICNRCKRLFLTYEDFFWWVPL